MITPISFRELYDGFDSPVTDVDCGQNCAPHNPSGKPFCCDICHAVPAAYRMEWEYLEPATDLWHEWRGNECKETPADPLELKEITPEHMLLLACLGPQQCRRSFRALSCRQFPFFPYINSRDQLIGLAIEWEFQDTCWVISNLELVLERFRREFLTVYDELFNRWEEEFDAYAIHSEELRSHYRTLKQRFPLLHRNGKDYLVSPVSERMTRVDPAELPGFGVYRENPKGYN